MPLSFWPWWNSTKKSGLNCRVKNEIKTFQNFEKTSPEPENNSLNSGLTSHVISAQNNCYDLLDNVMAFVCLAFTHTTKFQKKIIENESKSLNLRYEHVASSARRQN